MFLIFSIVSGGVAVAVFPCPFGGVAFLLPSFGCGCVLHLFCWVVLPHHQTGEGKQQHHPKKEETKQLNAKREAKRNTTRRKKKERRNQAAPPESDYRVQQYHSLCSCDCAAYACCSVSDVTTVLADCDVATLSRTAGLYLEPHWLQQTKGWMLKILEPCNKMCTSDAVRHGSLTYTSLSVRACNT